MFTMCCKVQNYMWLAWVSKLGFLQCKKNQTFLCSHTSQKQTKPLLHYDFLLHSSYVIFLSGSHFADVWVWHLIYHFINLLNVLFSALHRGAVVFLSCVCVCFCLHLCFTQDYDCNDVEGKRNNILLTLYLSRTPQCVNPTPTVKQVALGSVWIHLWCVYNLSTNLWLLQGEGMQIQTGPVCYWLLVCIHILCSSSSLRVLLPEHTTAFLPSLIACPQTPSTALTPHPYILPLHIHHHGSNPH